jgi:hypothetical protein
MKFKDLILGLIPYIVIIALCYGAYLLSLA